MDPDAIAGLPVQGAPTLLADPPCWQTLCPSLLCPDCSLPLPCPLQLPACLAACSTRGGLPRT